MFLIYFIHKMCRSPVNFFQFLIYIKNISQDGNKTLKPQHSNPNPNPLANQLWCIDFLTPPTPLIIPHRLPVFIESLKPLKN